MFNPNAAPFTPNTSYSNITLLSKNHQQCRAFLADRMKFAHAFEFILNQILNSPGLFNVYVGGSAPWQYVNAIVNGTEIIPDTDTDIFAKLNAMINMSLTASMLEKHLMLRNGSVIFSNAFISFKMNANDYNVVQTQEALCNFQIWVAPDGTILYDEKNKSHAKDFERFINNHEIICYGLKDLIDQSLAMSEKLDKHLFSFRKLAFVIKSLEKPFMLGKHLSAETAALFNHLFNNHQEIVEKLAVYLTRHYHDSFKTVYHAKMHFEVIKSKLAMHEVNNLKQEVDTLKHQLNEAKQEPKTIADLKNALEAEKEALVTANAALATAKKTEIKLTKSVNELNASKNKEIKLLKEQVIDSENKVTHLNEKLKTIDSYIIEINALKDTEARLKEGITKLSMELVSEKNKASSSAANDIDEKPEQPEETIAKKKKKNKKKSNHDKDPSDNMDDVVDLSISSRLFSTLCVTLGYKDDLNANDSVIDFNELDKHLFPFVLKAESYVSNALSFYACVVKNVKEQQDISIESLFEIVFTLKWDNYPKCRDVHVNDYLIAFIDVLDTITIFLSAKPISLILDSANLNKILGNINEIKKVLIQNQPVGNQPIETQPVENQPDAKSPAILADAVIQYGAKIFNLVRIYEAFHLQIDQAIAGNWDKKQLRSKIRELQLTWAPANMFFENTLPAHQKHAQTIYTSVYSDPDSQRVHDILSFIHDDLIKLIKTFNAKRADSAVELSQDTARELVVTKLFFSWHKIFMIAKNRDKLAYCFSELKRAHPEQTMDQLFLAHFASITYVSDKKRPKDVFPLVNIPMDSFLYTQMTPLFDAEFLRGIFDPNNTDKHNKMIADQIITSKDVLKRVNPFGYNTDTLSDESEVHRILCALIKYRLQMLDAVALKSKEQICLGIALCKIGQQLHAPAVPSEAVSQPLLLSRVQLKPVLPPSLENNNSNRV